MCLSTDNPDKIVRQCDTFSSFIDFISYFAEKVCPTAKKGADPIKEQTQKTYLRDLPEYGYLLHNQSTFAAKSSLFCKEER